jgi:hypothetical protein
VYVHPREIDANHPRLPLPLMRRFKCYVNLSSTMPKLRWLCKHHEFTTMKTVAAHVVLTMQQQAMQVEGARRRESPAIAAIKFHERPATPGQVHSS